MAKIVLSLTTKETRQFGGRLLSRLEPQPHSNASASVSARYHCGAVYSRRERPNHGQMSQRSGQAEAQSRTDESESGAGRGPVTDR